MSAMRPVTRFVSGISFCGAVLCSLLLLSGQKDAQAQDKQQDLQGILPDYVPDRLGEGDFGQLEGKWTDWAAETGRLVTDFYTSDNDDVRGSPPDAGPDSEEAPDDGQGPVGFAVSADLWSAGRPARPTVAEDGGRRSPAPDRRAGRHEARAIARQHGDEQPGRRRGSLQSYLNGIANGKGWSDFLKLNQVVTD